MDSEYKTATSNTYPALVGFDSDLLPPIGGLYVSQEYRLFVRFVDAAASTLNFTLNFRQLTDDGRIVEFSQNIINNNVNVEQVFTFTLAKGYLLAATVTSWGGVVEHGGQFVQIGLLYGGVADNTPSEVLAEGYLTPLGAISFPKGKNEQPGDGSGCAVVVNTPQPGAGANIIVTPPARARCLLKSFILTLVTSAAVANRLVRIAIADEGTDRSLLALAPAVQAASTTFEYSFFVGAVALNIGTSMQAPLPDCKVFPDGQHFKTDVQNLQAADQLTLEFMAFDVWASVS